LKRFANAGNLRSASRDLSPRNRRIVFYFILFLLIPTALAAQQLKAAEYVLKATYLYNFGRFAQWPADSVSAQQGGSFVICVIGQDPFGTRLDTTLSGESIDGRAVAVKRISRDQDAFGCRILYISMSEDGRLKEIFTALQKSGVLTVSDIPEFTKRGGMIQFVTIGNKIRFEVNLTSVENAGLSLSSDLLKVAVTVRKSPQPGD
jgi:hypothetical protein